jgi:hypothetical protein
VEKVSPFSPIQQYIKWDYSFQQILKTTWHNQNEIKCSHPLKGLLEAIEMEYFLSYQSSVSLTSRKRLTKESLQIGDSQLTLSFVKFLLL